MSQTLNLPNFASNNIVDKTQLTATVAAASSSLPVANAEDFTTQWLLIGIAGSNTAEILPNSSVNSGTTITLTSNTVLQHSQYDPVYSLFGNQLNIYRAADAGLGQQPPDSSFSLLGTVSIDPNNNTTSYTDTSGGGSYWYKYTFYNSTNTNETDIGSSVAVRGSFTSNYCSVDDIREEAGFRYATYISNNKIDRYRQQAQNEINGALDEFYVTPVQPPIPDYLNRITLRLAAGYLRTAQYSQVSDPSVNGQDMIDEAQLELDKLIIKERVLVTGEGQSLAQVGGSGEADGWPDDTAWTSPSYDGGARRVFRMGDIQGQPQTIDQQGNPYGNLYYGRKW